MTYYTMSGKKKNWDAYTKVLRRQEDGFFTGGVFSFMFRTTVLISGGILFLKLIEGPRESVIYSIINTIF